MLRSWLRPVLMLVVVLSIVAMTSGDALAGCLVEYNSCERCARAQMREAMLDFDLWGIRDANLALWDCGIDLNHCVFFGDHHDYACAV